ncbi:MULTISPECIES: MarR family transcriptional regulator [Streptomyces]|uniref:MarR family transcriptional regulator n=1 Tax=Streptomyces TaxID=1883 RepID=UPI0013F3B3A0|nr:MULTISPECIES: MarR family transcriptional regulator [Streptomyces]MBT3076837.1 MarR family transcriptional regulator [Streptomyces sp. COG21]MBT3082154.1 MarR family transcriptional regulator [Streptomyces sp. COG20]MBT3100245.1 MarR family transcriptional regulator [Streptomyces sp. CBG30]MBT3104123.1 MarR family transcriptional regulator [Streptomyces sp. COG19]MBT3111530.1 MarR family transcriptional regulator [Streptomyces sp. CYG20]
MATQHTSSAPQPPALSPTYPMANPGYGKRTAPDQLPRTRVDFTALPTRERYVAGFIDHLPEGASMSVKQLAKQLPLYGQQAISSALTALSVAGHLRRVRCPIGAGEETRWVFRTFWSRTARDNEWWTTFLATETATETATTEALSSTPTTPAPAAPALTAVPQQRTSPPAPATRPTSDATDPTPSPAYLALAHLGRNEHRLALSADDCATLEPQAAEWLARGVSVDYLTTALTAGLPVEINSPVGFLRRRLTDKMPPHLPAENTPPATTAPAHRILVECTDCGRLGRPEALPHGLCRPCRETRSNGAGDPSPTPTETPDIRAHMANLRNLLRSV